MRRDVERRPLAGTGSRGARLALAIAVAASLSVAACSDDDAPAGATQPTTTTADDSTTTTATDDGTTPSDDGGDAAVADPVALDAIAEFGNGVTARLAAVEAVEVEGSLPGEISGPGVAITVEITNGSDAPIDLDTVTVDLTDADGASASPITQGGAPLSGTLAPGDSTTGRYEYTLPTEDRADATLRVSYTTAAPTVLFTGSLPDA